MTDPIRGGHLTAMHGQFLRHRLGSARVRLCLTCFLLPATGLSFGCGDDDQPASAVDASTDATLTMFTDSGSPLSTDSDATTGDAELLSDATNDAHIDAGDATVQRPVSSTRTGARCTRDSDCEGAVPSCDTSLQRGASPLSFPLGYCSAACRDDFDCGPRGACAMTQAQAALAQTAVPNVYMSFPARCLKPCSSDVDCRVDDGYRCTPAIALVPAEARTTIEQAVAMSPLTSIEYCLAAQAL